MSPPSHDWEENRCSSMARTLMSLLWELSRYSVTSFQADRWLPSASFLHMSKHEVKSTWPLLEQQWESQWQISSIVSSQINQCTLPEHAIVYKLLQLSDLSEIGTGERQAEQTWISAPALALICCVALPSSLLPRASATSFIYRE